jgi:amino acid adenylation domain-containing protein/non-ribosomal peptide synthase protein (TIGR01720 family)/FkbM family methyltransferase
VSTHEPVRKSPIEDLYPLSPMQEGMLFHAIEATGGGMYVGQFGFTLRGELDTHAFARAWQGVVDRHPVLRSAFVWEKVEKPLQVVRRRVPLPLHAEDLRALAPAERQERVDAYVADDRARGFDTARPPLMRVALFRTGEREHRVVWTHHHLLLDGWSLGRVYADVLALYEGHRQGRAPRLREPRPYRDFIAWLQRQSLAEAEAFWRAELAGFRAPTPLGVERASPAELGGVGSRATRMDAAALREVARRLAVTPSTLVQGAWALLLSRYAGETDVVFGAAVSGRPAEIEGVDEMVGNFINTLPVRAHVEAAITVADFLAGLQEKQGQVRAFEHSPLVQVQGWSDVPRGRPLFESFLSFQNFPIATPAAGDDGEGLAVVDPWGVEEAEVPIALAVELREGEVLLDVSYRRERFEDATMERLLAHLRSTIRAFVARPGARLGEVTVLAPGERDALLAGGIGAPNAYPAATTVHAVIAERAARWPHRPAALCQGQALTYAELHARADALAGALRARGVGPEVPVAIFLDRSSHLAVAVLAVLRAGGFYVPVDPAYPAERIAFVLDDSRAAVVLTRAGLAGALPPHPGAVLCVDEAPPACADDGSPVHAAGAANLAYAIYTSGSTGQPKAAMVTHGALLCYATAMAAELGLGPDDRFLQFASPSFDVMVEEIFPAWLSGAAVVFPEHDLLGGTAELTDVVRREEVTLFELPTAYWQEWVRELAQEGERLPASVRTVIVGGERVIPGRLRDWAALGVPLVHVFGLTETTVTTTTLRVEAGSDASARWANLPVGRPIANAEIYVLDGALEPVPTGVAGELYIGGEALARGYRGRPALTAARFVPHPFARAGGARLYRTGDRVRRLEDGTLEFLGRTDQQVKIRGFRVEPAEIEAVLAGHPALRDVAVEVRPGPSGNDVLTAFVTPAAGYRAHAGGLQRPAPEWWPSHGEAGVYDDLMYQAMAEDKLRNRAYLDTLREVAGGRVVVDVGTGAEAVLARLALEAGARKVYAIETKDESLRQARALVERLGLADRIELVGGNGMDVTLPEPADVCVSELIGCIGGSEGASAILNTVWRLLKPGAVQVPRRCATLVAAVELPPELHAEPAFEPIAAHYAERILQAQGHRDDLKVCIRNLPREALLTTEGTFEDLVFTGPTETAYANQVELVATRDGRMDGFLMWIQLYMGERMDVNSLEHECCWLPMFFPAFYPGLRLRRGEVVRATCTVALAENGVHPEYRVEGALHRLDGSAEPFVYESFWRRPPAAANALHRRLVGPDGVAVRPPTHHAATRQVSFQELREHVARSLPAHMVPGAWVVLDSLPLTPHGKVDRRALAAPAGTAAAAEYQPPRTAAEQALASIWGEVLKVDRVGLHDNFFELGGDSILSIQVASRARRAGIQLRPRQIFLNATIAQLATVATDAPPLHAAQGAATGEAELAPVQRWFFAQEIPGRARWNMPVLLELRRPLEPAVLERALETLATHHDALRLRFRHESGRGWVQWHAQAPAAVPVERFDLSWIPAGELAAEIERLGDATQGMLELENGPVLRATLLEPGNAQPQRLLLVAHHLVVDAVSWRVLLEDLEAACDRLTRGEAVELPPKTTSYQRWTALLAARARAGGFDGELGYWCSPERAGAALLPTDLPAARAANLEGTTRRAEAALDAQATHALLHHVPPVYRTQVNDALLAALAMAFAEWTGGGPLLVEMEGHGREEERFPGVDLSRTVGWFTALYPVLLPAPGPGGPGALLRAVKEEMRRVPGSGVGYGALRWLVPGSEAARALASLPEAEVRFEYLGRLDAPGSGGEGMFALADGSVGRGMDAAAPRSHLLEVTCGVVGGRLEVSVGYSEAVHLHATAQRLADGFVAALAALVEHCARPDAGGYSPSDFPLAGLDAAALDALLGAERGIEDVYPVAPLQEGMLFDTVSADAAGVYVAQHVFELEGALDVPAFARAWKAVAERHAALRTGFSWHAGEARMQVVRGRVELPVHTDDWSALPEPEQARRQEAYLREGRARGFEVARPPLMRLALFRTGPSRHRFVWSFHQMVLDGWSINVVLRDLVGFYAAFARGEESERAVAPSPHEYIAWVRRQDHAAAEAFWRAALAGVEHGTRLPFAAPGGEPVWEEAEMRLPADETARLQAFARANRLTMATVLQGAWALLLSRYTGHDEVVFGTTTSGRPAELPGVEQMVMVSMNRLAVRVRVDAGARVAEWLAGVQARHQEAAEHPFVPLAQVAAWSGVPAGEGLFETTLVYENYPPSETVGELPGGVRIVATTLAEQAVDPVQVVGLPGERMTVQIRHDRARVAAGPVRGMLRHLRAVLNALAAAPHARLAELPLLPAEERATVTGAWNRTAAELPSTPVHRLFELRATETPERTALVHGDQALTYAEANERANRLARHLRARGVGAEERVALFLERGVDAVVALLAAMKAGGAYLALDAGAPKDRLSVLLADAAPKVIVTRSGLIDRLPAHDVALVSLDGDAAAIARESGEDLAIETPPESLAYVVYTSGSTGTPKGVGVEHRQLAHYVHAVARGLDLPAEGAYATVSTLAADLGNTVVFPALAFGGTLHVLSEEAVQDPAVMAAAFARHPVDVLKITPSHLAALLAGAPAAQVLPRRALVLGGEASRSDWAAGLAAQAPGLRVFNHYGPTETTVGVLTFPLASADGLPETLPLGAPLPNARVYVLDANGLPLPAGVPGELYAGGAGVARGYLGRAALTAERFLPDPFSPVPGARMYRTGDRARRADDGTVEFLGRVDDQVKIRGYRVEPGEIAAVLQSHPAVEQAYVAARVDEGGEPRLVAYVVPDARTAAPARRLLAMRRGEAADLATTELPDGATVFHLNAPETDFLYDEIFREQSYLRHGITVGPGATVFDVGANIGFFSLLAARVAPDARVFAFEPMPPVSRVLRANLELHGVDARVFECALSSGGGRASFTYYPHLSMVSGRYADLEAEKRVVRSFVAHELKARGEAAPAERQLDELLDDRLASREYSVELRSLSDVVRAHGIERIDLLKLDVQRSEMDVLAGIDAEHWPLIRQVVMEVHDVEGRLAAVTRMLESHGFHVAVEQEGGLGATDQFNLFATRAAQPEAADAPRDLGRVWGSAARVVSDAKQMLGARLPDYMVPSAFVVLDQLPLTANGKVDRRALPEPGEPAAAARAVSAAPRTPTEEILSGIWSAVLGAESLGVHDHFNELGGHSLKAFQLMSRVRKAFGVELPLRALFDAPTVAGLAAKVEAALRDGAGEQPPPIRGVPRDGGALPLSFAQQRVWFVDQMEPGNSAYNMPAALRLRGALDVASLERALGELFRRHEALRTTYASVAGQPVQVIRPAEPFHLAVTDLSALEAEARERRPAELAAEEAVRPFDLAADVPVRASLLKLGADEHVLLFTVHHIAGDRWSMDVAVREASALYAAYATGRGSPLPEPEVQYADFAAWQRAWMSGEVLERALAYWRTQLQDVPRVLEVPTDRPRPAVQNGRAAVAGAPLDPATMDALRGIARREGATLHMVLLAAYAALLRHYTGQERMVIGLPLAARARAETEGMIGFFVNQLPLPLDLRGDPSFAELVRRVRAASMGAYAHGDVPVEVLTQELRVERLPGRQPLVQTAFQIKTGADEDVVLAGIEVTPFETGEQIGVKLDLDLMVIDDAGGPLAQLTWDTNLWDASTAERLVAHYARLLRGAAADPTTRVGALPLMDDAERAWIAACAGGAEVRVDPAWTLADAFAAQAARTPDRPAVSFAGETLTYAQLDARANRLAHVLRARGVGAESRVGVSLHRSLELPVALLAIAKAGGAYVPLDPTYPAERLAFMRTDAGLSVLVSDGALAAALPVDGARLVRVDADRAEIDAAPCTAPPAAGAGADSLAYVVYTSGTTGTPKGVAVPHRGVLRLVLGNGFADFGADQVFLHMAPVAFDASTFEIWGALLNGARLALYPASEPTLAGIEQAIRDEGVTTLWLTAGLFHLAVDERVEMFAGVRQLLAGGDVLSPRHVSKVRRAHPGLRLINGYGPTESTTFAACHTVRDGDEAAPIPLGGPIGGTRAHVVDAALRPVPAGVPGELLLGGDGAARGYLNRPALTAERFVPDGFSDIPGARLYRTGDRVRLRGDGTLEFMGRTDFQAKIRGFRVEPGEVEAVLAAHPSVGDAVVLVREDTPGEKRLVGYVTGTGADAAALLEHLRERLPEYMVPAAMVVLSALPLNANGKVDRPALPAPEVEREGFVVPRTGTEKAMAGLFAELLGVDEVGADDDFFMLGGHSLLATQLQFRVREAFGVRLPLRDLFEGSTVSGAAARVDELCAEREAAAPTADPAADRGLPRADRSRPLPVSFSQRRLWFVQQLDPRSPIYNMPYVLRVGGALDVVALERALAELARRHEPLRTVFAEVDGEPVQVIRDPAPMAVPVTDLRALPEGTRRAHALRLMGEESARPFDLAAGPMMRATLVRTADEEHYLLVNLHHIVCDMWSLEVIVRELSALYAAHVAGVEPALAPLPAQYADFAAWQRAWLTGDVLAAEVEHWRALLAGAPPLLELPTDRPRPAVLSAGGRSRPVLLSRETTAALRELAAAEGATLFITLLAAYQALLARWSGQDDVLVGTPVAGRTRPETAGMIGFFVNTLVIRGDLSGDLHFRALLRRVRERVLEAHAHQELPFERLVEELNVERSLGHTPLYQVNFGFHPAPGGELALGDLELESVDAERRQVKFDLNLTLSEAGDAIDGELSYRTDLFDAATVDTLIGHFVRLVETVAAHPERPLSRVQVLDEAERRQVVEDFNRTTVDLPFVPAHRAFEAQAGRTPGADAIVHPGGRVSYAELDRRANQVAHHLRALGVGAEARVGILLDRSPEMVAAVLGTLKAGAAYVPLDPSYPPVRIAAVAKDSGAAVLLSAARLGIALPALDAPVVRMDADRAVIEARPVDRPPVEVTPRSLAYVVYTSGSTGTPKGALVEHGGVGNYLAWFGREVLGDETPWLPFVSRLSFDAHVRQLFPPLLRGGAVWLLPESTVTDPAALLGELAGRDAVTFGGVPSLWSAALDAIAAGEAPAPADLRAVLLGGEPLPAELVRRTLVRFPGVRIHNHYGPTETTVNATVATLDSGDVTIGRPIANVRVYLLDGHGNPVPRGVPGEVFVAGAGVGRGYLGQPGMTAERYLPDPFSATPGARMYRSGDRARWRADGRLEYVGRTDFQVKIRGFRIEPGEVEAVLAAHPALRSAVVVARQEAGGDTRLVAYAVPAEGAAPAPAELLAWLGGRLPEYMVPVAAVVLPAWPLTPNGKVDRAALPAPETDDQAFVAPRTDTEHAVAGVWAELLGVDRVGADDDFFLLGGHSLLATRVMARLRATYGIELPLRTLFESPTVAGVARAVDAAVLAAAGDDGLAAALAELDALSEDQVLEMLRDE